jgi:hypothetical protein
MPTSISTLLRDSSLSASLQIKSAEDRGIKAEGTKAPGFFGRIAQGFQRLFNREIQQRNRDGIEAYLEQLHDQDPDLEKAARAALKGRLDSGKPLTLRKIREIGSGVLARTATLGSLQETSRAINNRLSLYEQRIGEPRGEGGFLN